MKAQLKNKEFTPVTIELEVTYLKSKIKEHLDFANRYQEALKAVIGNNGNKWKI